MTYIPWVTRLIAIRSEDHDVRRRGATLIVVCLCFIGICLMSAPFVLLRGVGSWQLSALVLLATISLNVGGIIAARRGHVEMAGLWTSIGVSTVVHLSVFASQGLNMFLLFAALTPMLTGLVARQRHLLPHLTYNLILLTLVSWQMPDFAAGATTPTNFLAVLYILHLAAGALSYAYSATTASFFGELLRTQRALELARHNAEQASRAKSTFLANMSHELRTPLTAIIGYSEILIDEAEEVANDPELLVEDVSRINKSGRHLLLLINSVLDLAKVEAGKMEVEATHFSTRELVAEIEDTIAPLIQEHDNRLVLDILPIEERLFTDRVKLKQILLNLLSNAAKFTHGGEITLALTRGDEAGELVWWVRDTGIGIDEAAQQRIFEAFEQASPSTTRHYGGTGLGLSLCLHFSKMLGGELGMESAPDLGSTFWVKLPMTLPTSPREALRAETPA